MASVILLDQAHTIAESFVDDISIYQFHIAVAVQSAVQTDQKAAIV
jgi:hypothetical protein